MENKPNVLAGTINIHYDYIVGKVIKNGNVSNKKQYIQVLTENKTWEEAIEKDWRKTKDWQPGWNYEINWSK